MLPAEHVERAELAAEDTCELLRLLEERMPHLRRRDHARGSAVQQACTAAPKHASPTFVDKFEIVD